MSGRTWWSRWAEVAAWGISGLAWGLSYMSQYILARDHGYGGLAILWPLTVDLASLVAMLLALDMARRSLNALEAWAIAFGSALVMIGANVLMAWPDAISMVMHAWPPVIALACWHLLVHGRRQSKEARPVRDPAHDPNQPTRRVGARAEVRRLLARNPALTAEQVAKRADVSIPHARRLIREERQPRLAHVQPHVEGESK
jgi:hypothetical protein